MTLRSGTLPRVTPVKRTSLAETAYEAVLDAIIRGRLAAGDEISEVSLAAELGISRTPVAHAVQKLAACGLIDRQGGKQPRIAQFERTDVAEIYEMRELLESEACARAATSLPRDRVEALAAEADKLAAASRSAGWVERVINFDVRFHDELATAAGNRRLCEQIRMFRLLVRAFCRSTGGRDNLLAALNEHREILAALLARAPEKARGAMRAHIRARQQVVLAELYPLKEST